MKKFLASILTLALCLGLATGCAGKQPPAENDTESAGETGVKEIPSLKIAFSPYADADQITNATEPLEQMLKEKLLEKGYDVKDIDMTVGTSYTAVGEALSAGETLARLEGLGLGCAGAEALPEAKHIFSHIEWRMKGYAVRVGAVYAPAGCVWASREQMQDEYTLPGAFKAYKKRMGL